MAKMQVDKELIRDLADLLDETNLTEIEVEEGDRRIRVARGGGHVVHAQSPLPAPAAPAIVATADASPAHDLANVVKSPMVGTVYTAAEPGAAAFVGIGDNVREGETILIVEAMKVMNPIPAPKSGKVKEILVADAQPIEFGEPLMIIE